MEIICFILHVFLVRLAYAYRHEGDLIHEQIESNGCETSWTRFKSKCYKFVTRDIASFLDADKLCRKYSSNMLMVTDEDTQHFIMKDMTFPDNHPSGYSRISVSAIWLGIKPVVHERASRNGFNVTCPKNWVDGNNVTYHKFVSDYYDYHFGNTKHDNEHFIWFYFFIRISNETQFCAKDYIEDVNLKPCIVGEWLVNPGDGQTTVDNEVYGLVCEKDVSSGSSLDKFSFSLISIFFQIFVSKVLLE